MEDPKHDTSGVKASVSMEQTTKKAGLLRLFKRKNEHQTKEERSGGNASSVSVDKELPPVPFTQLFRFSTKVELLMNAVGLIAAAASGSAQPVLSIIFGHLTNDFVSFAQALAFARSGDPNGQAALPGAAKSFSHAAALNASYLVYIGIGASLCTFTYMYFLTYTGEVNAMRIRERYLRSVLRQEIAYFDNVGPGEVTTRIQTDTHLVQQGISEKVALVVEAIASFVAGFIIAYIRSWRLALALTSMFVAISLSGGILNKALSSYMQQYLKSLSQGSTLAEEAISSVRTAQALGSQKVLSNMYDVYIDISGRNDMKGGVWVGCVYAIYFFSLFGSYALAFDFGTTLINRGIDTPGSVITTFLAVLIGSLAMAFLAPEMEAITNACAAAAKLFETINRVPSIDSADEGGLRPEECKGEIIMEHIKFTYPSRPDTEILKDLSIHFPAGKSAALVGVSGSGKSTIVSLVERFYDPLSGVVSLDSNDLKTLNVKWLRSQIGLVSQEPTLFATTIKENVAHGLINTPFESLSEEKKMELIRDACIKANADGFISKLPMGYSTLVGERGFLLSGGQKQRIAIARAIVSDPRILLLDEATSALDTQSEGIVQNALDKAAAGRTTIIVAHRLSTIQNSDRIYVMGDGRVLERGTHEELLHDKDGAYSRLVHAQQLRDATEDRTSSQGDVSSINEFNDNVSEIVEKQAKENILGRSETRESYLNVLPASDAVNDVKKEYSIPYVLLRLAMISRERWTWYMIGTIAAIISGLVYVAVGIVFSKGIEGLGALDPQVRRHDGDRNALWFFIMAIVSSITIGTQNLAFRTSASALTAKLRSLSFRALLRQDVKFFDDDKNNTGKLTSDLSTNPQKINGLAGITMAAIIQTLSTLIGAMIMGIAFSWRLGLVSLAVTPCVLATGYIRLRIVVLKDAQNKKAHEASAQVACEAAGAVRTVASLTREEDCHRIYSQSLEEPLHKSNITSFYSHALFGVSQGMMFFVLALVFWYGSRLVAEQKNSTFDFFVVLMGTTMATIQAGNTMAFVPDIASSHQAASDIINLLDSQPEIDAEATDGKVLEKVQGRIRFENVHFRYPTRANARVLRGLNLTVEPGTYIALVGASGCGKSTTIQLIERFYDPLSGTVYIDEHPISELNVSEYRKHLALVSQEPTLYAGTVRFNILLGATKPEAEVTQEEIEEACRSANILDFIESLPDGFDTEVGGKGSQLSGGQKQRIAIARALLRNPKVLLLDEATSALDSGSEKVVQEALDRAAKGRTTIAIAHRLSTIQNADCIYFLQEGKIVESGTHDQLLALKGVYYNYVQLQALNKE